MYTRKEERVLEVGQWLAAAFPLPWKVEIYLVDKVSLGPDANGNTASENGIEGAQLIWSDDTAEIQLKRCALWMLIDVLQHEWAHLRRAVGHVGHGGCGEEDCVEQHDDNFFLELGRIYRAYRKDGGKAQKLTTRKCSSRGVKCKNLS